jgi:hypothetical protein
VFGMKTRSMRLLEREIPPELGSWRESIPRFFVTVTAQYLPDESPKESESGVREPGRNPNGNIG